MVESTEPPQPGGEDIVCAAAMPLIDIMSGALPLYVQALCRSVLSDPQHAANQHLAADEGFKRLFDQDAMQTMTRIWRTSSYPSDAACDDAGVEPGRDLERLTATSLGETARGDLNLPESLAAQITAERFIINQRRIVDAAVRYGYVVKHELRQNYKPLEATEKLHRLMLDFMEAYDTLVRDRTGYDDQSNTGSDGQAGR